MKETAFSVENAPEGKFTAVGAVDVENTSKTDLIVVTSMESTYLGDGDGKEVEPFSEAHTLLPGDSTIVSLSQSMSFRPTKLKVKITETEWFPKKNLKKLKADPRIKLKSSKVRKSDSSIIGNAEFETFNDAGTYVIARLVMRNSSGKLLGAIDVDNFEDYSKGMHEDEYEFHLGDWIENADSSESDIILAWKGRLI